MKLNLLPSPLTICRLAANDPVPAWAAVACSGFQSITRTTDELSVVCASEFVPAGVKQEPGWQAFKIDGPLDLGLTGILASVLEPLAVAGISIFALSTFDTDYVLVRKAQVAAAVQALEDAGHTVAAT